MSKGRLVIISGPSGSGKDTILKKAFEFLPNIKFSISSITRPMREGEVEGEKYNFISKEKFEDMIKNDMLLEYNNYVGNYYGTPRDYVEKLLNSGKNVFLEIEIDGARQVVEKIPEAITIYLMPPSIEELERRIRGRRSEPEEVVKERMDKAKREIKCYTEYKYVVYNDALEKATDEIANIILEEIHKEEVA